LQGGECVGLCRNAGEVNLIWSLGG
jgi:hypothetical protein